MDIRSTAPREAGRRLLFGLLLNLLFTAALQTAAAAELTVEEFSGAVKLKLNDRWRDPEAGMQVVLPATVSTGEDGSIELAQDGSVFSVASNTALEFFAGEDGTLVKRIVQSKGSAFYDISNREHLKLRVETPWLAAVVKGTEFNVTVEAASASVALFEGLLRIEAPDTGEAISLEAGFIARRGAGDPRITVIPMDGDEPVSGARSGVTPNARGGDGDGTSSRGGQVGADDAGEGGDRDPPSGDDAGSGTESGGDEPENQALPGSSLIEDELQAVIDEAQLGVGLSIGNDPVSLEATVGTDVGSLEAGIDAELDADLGTGEVGVDVGVDASAGDLVDAGVDAGLDADLGTGEVGADVGVDASAGDLVDAGVDAGLDADLGTGEVGADVGVDASAGDLVDAGVDAGLDADLGTGEVGADVGVDASAGDLVDAGIDAGLDADLGTSEVGADVGVDASAGDLVDAGVDAGLDTDLGTGEVGADLGSDVAIGDLDAGVDAGVDADLGSGDAGVEAGVGDVGLDVGLDDGGLDVGLDLGGLDGSTNLVDDLLGGDETDTGSDETEEEEEENLLPDLGGLLRL